ncbi:Diguanylate cyclase/phosphodiesterase [Agrobacterium deltaense Zutra 3/1]|uniref:Diguanylate cyclase/phosphodiesterase n=1 Tax=Agrobacterium deltaense Zutra 3/1 TaxID=1183427 RepID=A0A1S7S1X2_9HYPH|nr:bifunctional diguanylate cyclase/phosphodiesterase [Agrobacterium deltaense]CUX61122.1 Diguanylate cyclase/phosphodiesterase [Agrobacterium deltaense Zutra 3/1]
MLTHLQSKWFWRFNLPIVVSMAICGLLLLSLYWASVASDAIAVARQRDVVALTVSKLKSSIAHDQESATVWDDAVRNSMVRNRDWMDTNLGVWMNTYFGHDAAIVLTADLNPIYQFVVDPNDARISGGLSAAYLPLAKRLKERLVAGDEEGTSSKVLSIGEADIVYVGSRPAIISVKPIVSDTGDIEQQPGQQNLHVAVRFLDGDLAATVGQEYQFRNLRFTLHHPTDPRFSYLTLQSRSGYVVGYFEWQPFKPGHKVFAATIPAIAVAFLAIFSAASFGGNAFWRRSNRLQASREQLQYQATHDGLTGLANRSEFHARVAVATQNAREGEVHAVLFTDLDRFKEVNDSLGHPAGDKLISLVAARLTGLLPDALVARIGGDEFTVFVKLNEFPEAEQVAKTIVEELRTPFEIDGTHIAIGASVGLALKQGVFDANEAIRQADIALYHAKAAGRNTYAIFGDHMDKLLRKRRALEADLRKAVNDGAQIETFYQPVFSAGEGVLCSFEALARWNHPEFGYISPEQFIPLAEECGLIHEIGGVILEDACAMMAEFPNVDIALNASVLELCSPAYPLTVIAALEKWQIPAHRLEIEITESVATGEDGRSERNIGALRAAGVRFAIDDFGTGYSSFSRVQKIEVDRIKIDKSFIEEMHRSDSRALVLAMINIARAKGLKITAEGVETNEQRDILMSMGCHYLQGFLLSRPLSPDAARALLLASPDTASNLRGYAGIS